MGAGLIAMAVVIYLDSRQRERTAHRIEDLIAERRQIKHSPSRIGSLKTPASLAESIDQLGSAISQTKLYAQLLDKEDIEFLGKAGFGTDEYAQRFILVRLVSALLGLGLSFLLASGPNLFIYVIISTGAGFLAPKWILKSMATSREAAFERETIALVDIVRLLQGVGLSVDQSLEVIASQLQELIPVTGKLLYKAKPQVQSGVAWIDILKRISNTYANADFKALVNVLQQIDKFGGSVQEPLRQFADRLVEKERANVRERIGKLTIKLTSIMVATMLPGLLILTGGPGAISIIRTFERM